MKKRAYMCGVAFFDELEQTDATVYDRLSEVNKKVHDECGAVEVEIRFVRWARKPKSKRVFDLTKMKKDGVPR